MEEQMHLPCVEMRNLVKKFPGVVAVDHINLKVKHGEVFSLLGPSGCGKTTTLRILSGLETADEGDILIEGKIINDVPPYKRDCNLVFQNLALFPHMTVAENITYGLERKKVPKREIRNRVGEMLEFMQLDGMASRYPVQLSGGQQQRVALGRSLILKPKLLLLDEPLAALDRKLRKDMQRELKRIQQEVGITFFYVTHDQKVALAISDTIAIMRDGKLEQVASPEEIYNTPKTRFIADFMGAINIFSGSMIARSGEEIKFETESGLKIMALVEKQLRSNDIKGICVHPERIKVFPTGSDVKMDNHFNGRILSMIYQGDFVELKIKILSNERDESVTANMDAQLARKYRFAMGQEVTVQWDIEGSSALQG